MVCRYLRSRRHHGSGLYPLHVPESLPRGAGFAPGLADAIPDRLFKIDTQTGIQNEIQIDQNFLVVEKIQVSPDGKKIYISDKHQQGLFEVAL